MRSRIQNEADEIISYRKVPARIWDRYESFLGWRREAPPPGGEGAAQLCVAPISLTFKQNLWCERARQSVAL